MKKQKVIAVFIVLVIVFTTSFCSRVDAAELAVGGVGLASGGVALLGLLALSGVGMDLENNKKFNDLTDEEKANIESGLAQNFEEVGLQRGYAVEQIKSWVSDLQKGVLDKGNEVWDFFKEWATDVHITINNNRPNENGASYKMTDFIGTSWTSTSGTSYTFGADWYDFLTRYADPAYLNADYSGVICRDNQISFVLQNTNNDTITKNDSAYTTTQRGTNNWSSNGVSRLTYTLGVSSYYNNIVYINCSKPVYFGDNTTSNMNGLGFEVSEDIFSTNTDYLERLKGKNEPIEVIDVTDIKHPIVVSQPNTVANIDWNRGMNNNNNNDDDDKPVGALVPANVWYEHLDDYIDSQNDAIVEYDNSIEENPQDFDKIFINPSPIININNYNNTLPVINYPFGGTVVNNYYEYNNINNNNTTIYELPYNTDLIPMLPTLFFQNKFPFCIPWDIYNFLAMFYVEKEAPRIDVPFPVKGLTMETETITIDLSPYNYLSDVLRVMFFVLFIVGLAFVTRYLIKG